MLSREQERSRLACLVVLPVVLVVLAFLANSLPAHPAPQHPASIYQPEAEVLSERNTQGTPTPGPTCGPGSNYTVVETMGNISPATDLVPGSQCDQCIVTVPLPFTYNFYGQPFNSAIVGENGTLAFTTNPNGYSNFCLPRSNFNNVIMAHWDDLDARASVRANLGIYTSVEGNEPNRIFNIEWRTCRYANGACGGEVNFELRLHEGQSRFDIVYGAVANGGSSATIGVQRDTGSLFTQASCNVIDRLQPGTQFIFSQPPCPTSTPTLTSTATATSTRTSTSTYTSTVSGTFLPTNTSVPTHTMATTRTSTRTSTSTPIIVSRTPTSQPTATTPLTPTIAPTRTPTLMPTPGPTCGPEAPYVVVTAIATIVPGGQLVPDSRCDDCMLRPQIPFPYRLYGQVHSTAWASSNGNLQFSPISPDPDPRSACDPATILDNSIFGHWDDLDMREETCGPDCGIYTSVSGSAPNRIFNIEWRSIIKDTDSRVVFEIRLFEGQDRFDIIYDQVQENGVNSTVGVNGNSRGESTFFSCARPVLSANLQLIFTQPQCSITATPTTGAAVTPTNGAAVTPTPIITYTLTPTPLIAATPTPTPCQLDFADVQLGSTFYEFVRCLGCKGIISGYADSTFRPHNLVTRGQLAKIVSNAAGFREAPGTQIFQDVAPDHIFYEWINRLTNRGYMSGYVCGSPDEPCVTNRPYFRPFANATRAQTSKIVSNAARYEEPPVGETFQDVPTSHPFHEWIQRLASRGIMGGYECGGPGEPCINNRPYFRPYNDVTRGQSAKIVSNTFYPNCQTSMQP